MAGGPTGEPPPYPCLLFMTATSWSIIALRTPNSNDSQRALSSPSPRRSMSLCFLPEPQGTRIVPSDFGSGAPWFTPIVGGLDPPMRPEIPIRPQQPSRPCERSHSFPLLRADRLAPSSLVFVLFVAEHHHGDHEGTKLLNIRTCAYTE
jgi:hypothetical protein